MRRAAVPLSSNQPDEGILARLALIQRVSLSIVFAVTSATLLGWLVPPIAHLLPVGWDRMKFNTALLMFLAGLSISLSSPRRPRRAVAASRMLGGAVALVAAATLVECLSNVSLRLDTVFAADPHAAVPGRMIQEVAMALMLIGLILTNIRARKTLPAKAVDVLTLAMCLSLLLMVVGYCLQNLKTIEIPQEHQTSFSIALCFALLGWTIFNRRIEYSSFSVLIGGGIAGRVARFAAPLVLFLPFTVNALQGLLVTYVHLDQQLVMGLTATTLALFSFCAVVALCRRIGDLENTVRELSLRDELTGLYNRRGFNLLAEQSMRLARRGRQTFEVFFFDVDNLKKINDALGHEVGSELLAEMGKLMTSAFRETDVLGRLGGDEFVAACKGNQPPGMRILQSLEGAVEQANALPGRRYAVSFSIGVATMDPDTSETLEELVKRADKAMYDAKRARKSLPTR